ncbi:hypothetical protein [Pseudarthrobacter sp. DSP2-3-2b1]|uniref:hypothetical protein n=1 Tax=Pseudarthrobacter sp. DSP2-3-2b1 TaxID=2804661 RepID=UPI003CFB9214
MFIAKSENYRANTRQAATLTARPAILITPEEGREPAILLRSSGQIHGVLPLGEGMRLATEIADIIAAQREAQQ